VAHLDNYDESVHIYTCPRCGRVWDPRALVEDGYTRIKVCGDCWDPPDPLETPPDYTEVEDEPEV
jgi:hypothetical protein